MKLINQIIGKGTVGAIALCGLGTTSFAVDGLTLSIQNTTNVLLSWSSTPGTSYIVQYRPTLSPEDGWQTLSDAYPAASGTNRTSFVHADIVCYPSGSGGSGGGGNPPGPESFSSGSESAEEVYSPPPLPPHPGDPSSWTSPESKDGFSQLNDFGGESSGGGVCSGFYRVFHPTPVAEPDFFAVPQGSQPNQLDILNNDHDPDGNLILLSAVESASHGTINYNSDASVFTYTPSIGFYGMDTFSYGITNDVGGTNSAPVFVFTTQSGNGHPSAPSLEFTLLTNQTVVSFPILTNITDPNSDTLQLAYLGQPNRGTTATNGSGSVVYTRTSGYLAQDKFFYVVTDGRGGFARRLVTINPQDSDEDGMPDEWELAHGLNVTQNDAHADPDNDGLPNLAEYKLDTNPAVADNPLNLENVATNQVFGQHTYIPVPIKSHLSRQSIALVLSNDVADASLIKRADGCWYLSWNTIWMTNGTYPIGLSFQYFPQAVPPAESMVAGQTKGIVVSNVVSFAKWTSEFNHTLALDLKFAFQNADFRIELYDEQNQPLVYLASSTTNGSVQSAWNLKNGQGQQVAFSHVRAAVFAKASGNGSLPPVFNPTNQPNNELWFVKQTGGVTDTFAVAWGWDAYSGTFYNLREGLMLNGVINIIGSPASFDSYALLPNGNVPFGGSFRYDNDQDKAVLLDALKSSGNFFWFGHGSTASISGNDKRSSLLSDDVEKALDNKKHRTSRKVVYENKRPYRLVILNGCSTYHPDWANAFGIDFSKEGSTDIVLEYQFTGRKPQAFVGWTVDVDVPPSHPLSSGAHAEYALALGEMFSRWMGGFPLETCLDFFADTATSYGFTGQDKWRISGCYDLTRYDP